MASQPVIDFATARKNIESLFQHELRNPDLLREALYADGPRWTGTKPVFEGNKRLAQVGDAAIAVLVMHSAYIAELSKGDSDNLRKSKGDTKNLDRLGRAKDIEKYLTLSLGTREVTSYMMATAVEAIFGAFFEDSMMNMNVMERGSRAFGLLE